MIPRRDRGTGLGRLASSAAVVIVALAVHAAGADEPAPAGESPAETGGMSASLASLTEAFDQEIERVRQHALALDAEATELDRAGSAERERLEAARTRVAELNGQLQIRPAGSDEVGNLYARIVEELKLARPALAGALDRAGGPTELPRFEPGFDPTGLDVPGLEDRIRRLGELRHQADARRAALLAEEHGLRREMLEGWASITGRLNELRTSAIANLPSWRRRQVLGVGREGIAQLGREVEQLKLAARLYRASRLDRIDRLPGRFLDVFAVGSATWTLLKVVTAVALFFLLRRRGARIRKGAYRFVGQAFATPEGRRRGSRLLGLVEVVAPWGLFLGLIAALRWSIGPLAETPELDLPLRIAALYGLYRLAIDVLFATALGIARRYRLSLDEGRTAEVLRSVRTMLRVVVGIFVLLMLSERLVGRGHLYYLMVRFAWIFVLGAGLLILARWRGVIAEAYLGVGGRGRLAELVGRSRSRWYGVFVSAAAFVLLAGRACLRVGRDFAMGFDQTRRALAFLFRRRVEKRAEERGYAEFHVDELPRSVVEAFAETPVSDTTPAIDHYPGFDRL